MVQCIQLLTITLYFTFVASGGPLFKRLKSGVKSRPSSAGGADFPQIPFVGAKNKIAYQGQRVF
jgi:hypothetical protein